MAQKHPDNAVYVAKDAKSGAEVSFDQWGRKLDSNGNVVAGDRQRAGDAGAQYYERPQQQQPQQQFVSDPNVGSRLTQMLTGRTPAAQRGAYGNAVGSNNAQGSQGAQPSILPGGIDPATGLKVPTAYNPYQNKDFPPSQSPRLQPGSQPFNQSGTTGSTDQWRTGWAKFSDGKYPPAANMPYPPTGDSLSNVRNEPTAFEPYSNVGLPVTDPLYVYRTPDTSGPQRMFSPNIPNPDMPYPPTGNSVGNVQVRQAARNWPDDGRLPMINGANQGSAWAGFDNQRYDNVDPSVMVGTYAGNGWLDTINRASPDPLTPVYGFGALPFSVTNR